MIPTMMLVGLVAGLALRTWWTIPVLGVAWSAVIYFDNAFEMAVVPGAFLVGAVNAAVGVAVGRAVRHLIDSRRHA